MARNVTRNQTPATDATPATDPTLTEETPVTTDPTMTPDEAAMTPEPADPFQSTVEAYRAADVAGKAKIRKGLNDDLMRAVRAGDLAAATFAQTALDKITTKAPKAPAEIDYTALITRRAAEHLFAAHMILSGNEVPAGLPGDYTYPDFSDDEIMFPIMRVVSALVDVEDVREAATKIATAKIASGPRAARRDIGAHLTEVLSATPGVFRTVAQIAGTASEAYGDDRPSSGAVAARLFADGGCTVPNVRPIRRGHECPDSTTAPADGAVYEA